MIEPQRGGRMGQSRRTDLGIEAREKCASGPHNGVAQHSTPNIQHPEKLQDRNSKIPTRSGGARLSLELVIWIFSGGWRLDIEGFVCRFPYLVCLALLLICLPAFAQKNAENHPVPIEPAAGER